MRPQCGRVVGFGSGKENPHGVRAVTKGQRCAVALWFTLDPSHEEKERIQAGDMLEMFSTPVNEEFMKKKSTEPQADGPTPPHQGAADTKDGDYTSPAKEPKDKKTQSVNKTKTDGKDKTASKTKAKAGEKTKAADKQTAKAPAKQGDIKKSSQKQTEKPTKVKTSATNSLKSKDEL